MREIDFAMQLQALLQILPPAWLSLRFIRTYEIGSTHSSLVSQCGFPEDPIRTLSAGHGELSVIVPKSRCRATNGLSLVVRLPYEALLCRTLIIHEQLGRWAPQLRRL